MRSKDPIVFVTQIPSRHTRGDQYIQTVDISSAKNFGEPRIIFPMGMNYPSMEIIADQLEESLADFQDQDFLLPLGDTMLMIAAAAILGRSFGDFTMLKWDRQERKYFTYLITV